MLLPAKFHEPAQLWAIDPSLLLVHTCGIICHFISVTLNYRFSSFAGYCKRICLAEDRGAYDLLLDVVRLINVLTYLLIYLPTEFFCPTGFLCGRPISLELIAKVSERPGRRQREFQETVK